MNFPASPACYVVPATVVGELDLLAQRPETRAKARAALNCLKGFVERGATLQAVSAGQTATLRIGAAAAEQCPDDLNQSYADDRILAAAIRAKSAGARVVIATTDFALYVRAKTFALEAVLVERLATAATASPASLKRKIHTLESAWDRLVTADSAWKALSRGIRLVALELVVETVASAEVVGDPPWLVRTVGRYRQFNAAWQPGVSWHAIVQTHLGLPAPTEVSLAPRPIWDAAPSRWAVPTAPGFGAGSYRAETAEERAARLRAEERSFRDQEQFLIDSIVYQLEPVFHWVLAQVDSD